MDAFVNLLRRTLDEPGMTQAKLGEILGVDQSTISKYTAGTVPSIVVLDRLLKHAGCDLRSVFPGNKSQESGASWIELTVAGTVSQDGRIELKSKKEKKSTVSTASILPRPPGTSAEVHAIVPSKRRQQNSGQEYLLIRLVTEERELPDTFEAVLQIKNEPGYRACGVNLRREKGKIREILLFQGTKTVVCHSPREIALFGVVVAKLSSL